MKFALKTKLLCWCLNVLVLLPVVAHAQPYDATWTFGNVSFEAYRLDAFSPSSLEFPALATENPTLPLELGNRYQVRITNYSYHPFEVLSKAVSPSQDVVLLSMAIQGSFENDPEVAWEDNGNGTVHFTLTEGLYQAMITGNRQPGYRCRPHSATMRGDFTVAGIPIAHRIAPSPNQVDLLPVASGLTAPGLLLADPMQPDRLIVVDQAGQIRVIDQGQLIDEPLLDLSGLLVPLRPNYDERGLLGLAFHPGFSDPENLGHGRFYTYASEPVNGPADFTLALPPDTAMDHQSVVREWQWDGNSTPVDANTSRELLRVDQPQRNHNAGHLAFGPDGYLYIAFGDGGGANDTAAGHGTLGNGQNIDTLHGSIARIDPLDPTLTPDSPDPVSANGAYRIPADNPFVGVAGVDEIYAYGFRNPYRFSFDARSGALIVPDVGQGRVEEFNIVHKGGNYGWNIKEGIYSFDPQTQNVGSPLNDPIFADPLAQYDHDDGLAVVGGYTYYGSALPSLWGQYVCGDFSQAFGSPLGRLFTVDLFTGTIEELLIGVEADALNLFVKGFGQDLDGEIYLLASTNLGPTGDTGVVLKLVASGREFDADLTNPALGATGKAVFSLSADAQSVTYEVSVQDLENITMGHIHIADTPGGNGPPAVWLYPAAPPAVTLAGSFSGVLGEGSVTAADFVGPLGGLTISDLLTAIKENRAYVNVHTTDLPAGAIRGTIKVRTNSQPLGAILTGDGAGTNSTATGVALLKHGAGADTVIYEFKVQGLTDTTMAHIHIADVPGGNGPPAVWLYPQVPPAAIVPGSFTGVLGEGSFTDDDFVGPLAGKSLEDLFTAIQEQRAYVNVHTTTFPGGEIRGPLE